MLPTEFSVDEEELGQILVGKDLVQCDVQVNTNSSKIVFIFLFLESILVEKDLVQCEVQVNSNSSKIFFYYFFLSNPGWEGSGPV